MPRVHRRTRKRAVVKRAMTCSLCHQPVEVGQEYYTWARKASYGGTVYFNHVACGFPKPTQLSSRKTAAIDEAISDAEWPSAVQTPDEAQTFLDDVKATITNIAEVAREVGQEYQDAYDAMPEGLNQGETAQACETAAQELESWADDLDSWDPSSEEPDVPEREETPDGEQSDEEYEQAVTAAVEQWCDDVLQEAQDASSEYPEYQG